MWWRVFVCVLFQKIIKSFEMSMKPTQEQVETLRDLFFKKCETEQAPCGSFHPIDLVKVKTKNSYLEKYLEHNDFDMKLSLQMLWDILVWRKNFGTNEINESNIRMGYVYQGIVFPHNKDKDGKTLLIFKAKQHVKGSKDMKDLMRVVAYWIERVLFENRYDKMSVFFDMQGTGVGNVDMNLIKNIIETIKMYPLSLNYIIIYELPWLLNAEFKIIKSLMPRKAVEIMKFVNPKTLSDYVDDDNKLACWGGKDNYVFSFQSSPFFNDFCSDDYPFSFRARQKRLLNLQSKQSINSNKNGEVFDDFCSDDYPFSLRAKQKRLLIQSKQLLTPNNEDMLRITPDDVIVLSKAENYNGEYRGSVHIKCTSKYPITYKIKTTLKFRVRPSLGTLTPGSTATVFVVLLPGKEVLASNKDKFLVICTPLPDDIDVTDSDSIAGFWKALPLNSPNVQQHRLQCICSQESQGDGNHNGHVYADDIGDRKISTGVEMSQLYERLQRIEQQTKLSVNLLWLLLLVFIIVSIALTYIITQEIQG